MYWYQHKNYVINFSSIPKQVLITMPFKILDMGKLVIATDTYAFGNLYLWVITKEQNGVGNSFDPGHLWIQTT